MKTSDQIPVSIDTYTAKEEKFCYEYCLDLNATQAAIRAGYSRKTAKAAASRLLTKVNLQKKIGELQGNLAETAKISALRLINEHAKIAFSNIADLHIDWTTLKDFKSLTDDQKACIQEIAVEDTREGKNIKIKLFDKLRSLNSLSNILGFNAPVKAEITGKDGKDLHPALDLSKLTNDELKRFHALLEKASGLTD
jgi:phage terminase small subunit